MSRVEITVSYSTGPDGRPVNVVVQHDVGGTLDAAVAALEIARNTVQGILEEPDAEEVPG